MASAEGRHIRCGRLWVWGGGPLRVVAMRGGRWRVSLRVVATVTVIHLGATEGRARGAGPSAFRNECPSYRWIKKNNSKRYGELVKNNVEIDRGHVFWNGNRSSIKGLINNLNYLMHMPERSSLHIPSRNMCDISRDLVLMNHLKTYCSVNYCFYDR